MSKSTFPRESVEGTPTRTRKATAPMPHWVIAFLAILLVLALVFVILHLTGHGMGQMHMSIIEAGRTML